MSVAEEYVGKARDGVVGVGGAVGGAEIGLGGDVGGCEGVSDARLAVAVLLLSPRVSTYVDSAKRRCLQERTSQFNSP